MYTPKNECRTIVYASNQNHLPASFPRSPWGLESYHSYLYILKSDPMYTPKDESRNITRSRGTPHSQIKNIMET
jgi:hypothetical protein